MRITIDAVPLLLRSAGVKNYLYYWTRSLLQEANDEEIRLFPLLGKPHRLDHQSSTVDPLMTLGRLGLLFCLNRLPAGIASAIGPHTDVFHTCKLLNPPRRAKLTATLHDLTCWILPETHSPTNVAADKRFAERILKRADGLIAVSESTRSDAVRVLNLPAEKICVIHHGVSEAFFNVTESDAERARQNHGLKRPYVLFAGTIEPRKNVDLLLNAYLGLPASVREEFDLVLAGPPGWAPSETLARLAEPPSGVRYLGYVLEEDMPALFAGAELFVYPSLYEGFGFPVAQAMAAGTPVITSNVSALPEIAGGAAVLVDPRSEAELRDAMREVLTSASERQRLVGLGRRNAARYSWPESARRSLEFFRNIGG